MVESLSILNVARDLSGLSVKLMITIVLFPML